MLDSTYNQNKALKQAASFNVALGTNMVRSEASRLDVVALLGGRHTTKECPPSYLGYQCYADTEPSISWGLNYGAMLLWSTRKMALGVRATGESTQVVAGFRF